MPSPLDPQIDYLNRHGAAVGLSADFLPPGAAAVGGSART